MPKLSKDQWEEARTAWEADPLMPMRVVAAQLGVTAEAVRLRVKKEGWTKVNTIHRINAIAMMQAGDGVPALGELVPATQKKTLAQAVQEAVDARTKVIERHREEWKLVRLLRKEAVEARERNVATAFEKAKLAKITAEMTAIQQAGERKAWGFDDQPGSGSNRPETGNITITIEREDYVSVPAE